MAKKEVQKSKKKDPPLNEKYYIDLKAGTVKCTTDSDCAEKYGGGGNPEPMRKGTKKK